MKRTLALLVAGLLCSAVTARAADVRDLIRQGNEHYAAGRYAEALEAYKQAAGSTTGAVSAELLHDQAAAHFKLGELNDARELWARAKEHGDAASEARARYNLGNCDYAEALTAAQQQDAQKALDLLAKASDEYRAALGLDPTLTDARANLELTYLLRQEIEKQSEQQPQSQPTSQSQKKKSDSQPSTQQSQSQPSSQPQSQPSSQPQSQPQDQQSDQQQQAQEQQQKSQEEQPQQEQQEQQQEEQAAPESQPAAESQPAPQSQPAPAESQPAQEQPEDQGPRQAIHLNPAEAERLLQMIRDAEQARRKMLLQQRRAAQKPVDRDW